jgi:RNA polymerase sigma-70 factor (ECF subfamily)
MTDWELPEDPLAALSAGEPGPFEAFVVSHAQTFFAYFRRQGADRDRAQDLCQEVFLRLYHHAARYRPEERFQSYCFRVARNVWIDDQRRSAARPRPGSLALLDGAGDGEHSVLKGPSPAGDPAARSALHEESERLRAVLRTLAEHHRTVFELGVVQELSYAEIAAVLEIPVGTVKSRMFHAVRKLREALGEDA